MEEDKIPMYPQAHPLGFEDTSVNMTPMPAMKRPVDHLAWSLFNFAFFNGCCLGYVATVFSIRSRDSRQMNDALGAAKHASTAKTLNIVSTAIGVIITLILFVVMCIYLSIILQIISRMPRESQEVFGERG